MEIWTLDENLKKSQVIEGYTSFIWTDRYNQNGDFKIDTTSTSVNRNLLTPGTMIAQSESKHVMRVKTITDKIDDDGSESLEVTGLSMEALLDDRIGMTPAMVTDIVTNPKWVITDTPGNIARTIFNDICVNLVLDSGDAIPFYHTGALLPAGSIAEPSDIITVNLDPDTVYNLVASVCQSYNLGFRLVRNGETSEVYFEIYTGNDHTTSQTSRPAVVFSPEMDTLSNVTRLTSIASHKTVAYVVGADRVKVVFGIGENTTASGFDRRVLFVDANNIDATNVADVDAALSQAGLNALSEHRKIYQFDGEISEFGQFRYGVDYDLGDLVEERDATGLGNQMMVTEQIFVSDNQGDRSYPTLTKFEVIVPGTWIDWTPPTQAWSDVPDTVVWGNL